MPKVGILSLAATCYTSARPEPAGGPASQPASYDTVLFFFVFVFVSARALPSVPLVHLSVSFCQTDEIVKKSRDIAPNAIEHAIGVVLQYAPRGASRAQ